MKTKYHSKSSEVYEWMRKDLERGLFPAGFPLPSDGVLAEKYQISRSTIRKIIARLEDEKLVRREANRGVWPLVDAPPARPMTVGNTIAFAWAGSPNSMVSEIHAGIRNFLNDNDYDLQVINSSHHEEMLQYLRQAESLNLKGVIAFPFAFDSYLPAFQGLMERGLPVVCVDRGLPGVKTSVVLTDNALGMYGAARHLLMKREQPVYYFGTLSRIETQEIRRQAYLDAMYDAGFAALVDEYSCLFQSQDGREDSWRREDAIVYPVEVARKLLRKIGKGQSILCMNDYCALALYLAAESLDYVVGRDLYVVGFDDLPMARCLKPQLTTVHQDFFNMGYQAARLMLAHIAKQDSTPVRIQLPAELIIRQSD